MSCLQVFSLQLALTQQAVTVLGLCGLGLIASRGGVRCCNAVCESENSGALGLAHLPVALCSAVASISLIKNVGAQFHFLCILFP